MTPSGIGGRRPPCPGLGALVGQDEVAHLAAGRAEREQQADASKLSPAHTSTTQASPPTASTTPTAAARVTGRRCTNRTQPRTSAGARYSTSRATPTGMREIAAK